MPITPDPPFPKTQGDNIRSRDWNDVVNEVIRLDTAKFDRVGGRITGPLQVDGPVGLGTTSPNRALTIQGNAETFLNVRSLTGGPFEVLLGADPAGGILSVMTNHDLQLRAGGNTTRMVVKANGNVGIGTLNPGAPLHVESFMAVGPFAAATGVGSLNVTGPAAEFSFVRRPLTAWPANPAAGDRFVWYNPDGNACLFTDQNGDLLRVSRNGDVRLLRGDLQFPTTGGGGRIASFTNRTFQNESQLSTNNLKLSMFVTGFGGSPPLYQFIVGHEVIGFGFARMFSVDQTGRGFFANGVGCHIVDYFLNGVGDTLEQGDVVVLNRKEGVHYYGSNNNIPIPEVDLTDQAYDHRVCGIVAEFVPAHDLPTVDPNPNATAEEVAGNPLRAFGGPPEGQPHSQVKDQQMGRMVTLGAWAHCKVDADIAPIQTGDLLTTSPTKGHAQKVLDPARAIGAILGKALGSQARGKGKIPVLVLLQ